VLQMDFVALEGTGMPCRVGREEGCYDAILEAQWVHTKKGVWDTTNSNFNL